MKTGQITISENGVSITPVNNTVWLTKAQLADFFGVFINTITNNLRPIFKSGILYEHKVTCTHSYPNHTSTKRQTIYYNLDIIIALSYRIQSSNAELFREWMQQQICQAQILNQPKPPIFIHLCQTSFLH